MSRLTLTLAISEYDHVRDLTCGLITPEGIDLICLNLPLEEIFYRFIINREWDVSEMSFAKYASLISQGDTSLSAIPVFPSRVFRHSSLYVRSDGPVKTPADLVGRRVGIPEWAQTASVYSRGFLKHEFGIDLASIEWVQAGVNQPGRAEKVQLQLPQGVRLTRVSDNSLSEMLRSGKLDAVLSARPPQSFLSGKDNVVRLFEDFLAVEGAYFDKTKIFPIMHVVAIRRELLDQYPWIATNLMTAFEQAKDRSVDRALDVTATRFPIPWCYEFAHQAQSRFGQDYWPYGIEKNQPTLEAFLQYAHEQGVCHRLLTPEELFPKQTQSHVKV